MSKLMSRLGWAWRLVMTGLCFVLFGLGGLLLSVVWFNILLVLVWDTSRRRRLARRSIAASFSPVFNCRERAWRAGLSY